LLEKAWAHRSLAEQPKVGELQMDWLRSEDLKEEKVVTTPSPLYHVEGVLLDPNYGDGRAREIIGI
jgi:hypothetical protein